MIRADKLQRIAEVVMVAGIVALCQPWNLFLHRYGLTVIIVGLVTFLLCALSAAAVAYTALAIAVIGTCR